MPLFPWLPMLLVLLAYSLPAYAGENEESESDRPPSIKVFILAGQSNMVGSGRVSELPAQYRDKLAGVKLLRGEDWNDFQPHGNRFGPEVAFAHAMAKAYPGQTIALVKHAVGGTSLLAWAPDWKEKQAARTANQKAGPLYKKLMEQVKPAASKSEVEIAGVLWMQGERDARFPVVAQQYGENLERLIAALRQDTGVADLPFILGQVNPPPKRYPGVEAVRQAQADVAKADPKVVLVSTEDLEKHTDNLHYNTAGQLALGKRFAEAYLQLQSGSK